MKLGARILKTGIAIILAFYLSDWLNLPAPTFAAIAAIFALQPSIYRSYKTIIEQVQANVIGALIAVMFGTLFGHSYAVAGFAVVVTLVIMMQFKLESSISLALVTVIVILEFREGNFIEFSVLRFATVMTGVLSAFIINLIFLPPKYEDRLFSSIRFVQSDIIRWIRLAVRQASEHTSTKQSLRRLRRQTERVNELYKLYKEERGYTKKARSMKTRKLVVYRQMIITMKKSIELLNRLHLHENELSQLPERFHIMIQARLDFLLTYHEQLILKHTGKLKTEHTTWIGEEEYLARNEVMDVFAQYIVNEHAKESEEEFSSYHLLHIISRILDYEENLEHLDLLITSYQSHHSTESYQEKNEDVI